MPLRICSIVAQGPHISLAVYHIPIKPQLCDIATRTNGVFF